MIITELSNGLSKWKKAHTALKKKLKELEPNKRAKISVYCFGDGDDIRIAEISTTSKTRTGSIGASWLRAEPNNGSVILAAEDFILTYDIKPYRPRGWESDIDEHVDAVWKLEQALKL